MQLRWKDFISRARYIYIGIGRIVLNLEPRIGDGATEYRLSRYTADLALFLPVVLAVDLDFCGVASIVLG